MGFSSQWCLLLRSMGSGGCRAPEQTQSLRCPAVVLLCGTWDPPGSGIEPVSPALTGGLLSRSHRGGPGWHLGTCSSNSDCFNDDGDLQASLLSADTTGVPSETQGHGANHWRTRVAQGPCEGDAVGIPRAGDWSTGYSAMGRTVPQKEELS